MKAQKKSIADVFISANLAAPRINPQKWVDILLPANP